ncbi:MAG: HAMP domain-containing histidine kinase [Nitrospirae bacterium]|nr:HAMP domain-containing histidine kinase [Nitrospirota bacterium]
MRTKLFSAFIFVILLALLSNIAFERLIMKDFDDFLKGTKEDQLYWVLASIEGSYKNDTWDHGSLHETLHWGLMLGFETYLEDSAGRRIMSSADVLFSMDSYMLHRMRSYLNLPSGKGDFTWYPLYIEGREIGKLYVRPLERFGALPLKEEIFRKRGREFLVISFMIAGAGALLLSVLFTSLLSKPVMKLTEAAGKIARGEFAVLRPKPRRGYTDELDMLTETFFYMAEALKREDLLRKHLTSNITHELRTPLTIIKGNLEAVEDGVLSDPGEVFRNINSEVRRMISLVEGIEDITRAEASFFRKGDIEEINLRDFVESTAGVMKKLIEEKGLYLTTEGPPLIVKTYPEKLHIILKNLLTNAFRHTGSGGIAVKWDKHVQDHAQGFLISVEDTGSGIEEGRLSKIFERFYKDEESGGKGLGLAIVKELVEVMGGRVEVDSAPGKGSKFTVIF